MTIARTTSIAAFFAVSLGCAAVCQAKVFYSRQGAMKLAFPGATKVERKHVFLTATQLASLAKSCRCKPKTKLVTVYLGKKDGATLGYAYIDTHVVRTLPETFMVVITPAGLVRAIHILAFHEPPEYMPARRWLGQFYGAKGGARLQTRGGIAGIAGRTLSANAITAATRRILALHQALGLGTPKTASAR